MEERDVELIAKLIKDDEELKRYVDEHIEFEKKLDKFGRKPYLTPDEELERKKIQKLKLAGRDRVEEILSKYR